ncbi:uncharacterized protein LOC132731218 [Ruditapes philippinarum]|uniref:uncharacterized protein LOC132731218 n=1 Tax=Ruditapes philippinarum TaxID=129788 RepID=UPI00295BF6BE|nr:uncharacterized protein LOC132731218 [Ruditapes philippinarum]
MTGAESITCSHDGSWSMSQPTCFKTSVEAGQQGSNDGTSSGVAIAFGVLFGIATIVAIILAVIAWRLWKKYKSVGGAKASTYIQDVKPSSLFDEIDRDKITPSRAPLGHQRHVTDMGRADSSLAPLAHLKHVTDTVGKMSSNSPAPLTTRNIELQKPPMMIGHRSPTMYPAMSATPSSLRSISLGSFLPEQIGSPRDTSSPASNVLDIPKIQIEDSKPKRVAKKARNQDTELKSGKLSPFMPIKETPVYREGSPLPQQILTPRNADDIARELKQTKNSADDKPRRKREKKPKGDLIDKDKNLLKIYSRKDTSSPTPGIPSPQYQKLAGYEQDNEISDIEV